MKLLTPHLQLSTRKSGAAFTIIEVLVTLALSSILLVSIVSLTIFTARSFAMMRNYEDLNRQSRDAVDVLGKDIRNASELQAYTNNATTKSLKLYDSLTSTTTLIVYNASAGTLITTQKKGSSTMIRTNLTQCDSWEFSLYNRAPNTNSFTTNIVFYPTSNPPECKMINLSWRCSRKILALKLNTESVQTAQIILRNQVTY